MGGGMKGAHDEAGKKAVALSGWIYRHLLAVYPPGYRHQYGPDMGQLFRDQCRDAWRGGRGRGLAGLWLRVLPDLIKTSVLEHLSALRERKTTMEKISAILFTPSGARRVFVVAFAVVFLLVVATSTLITFVLPENYASATRVYLRQAAGEAGHSSPRTAVPGGFDPNVLKTQLDLIGSEAVLGKVVSDLDLDRVWGKRYGGGSPLLLGDAMALLKKRTVLRPVRHTGLIEIRVFSEEALEAANLANAIARAYAERSTPQVRPAIVDLAVPSLRPARPNKPLNIAIGVLGGTVLATAIGAGVAGIVSWFGRRSGAAPTGSMPGPGD
jgi:capsular polysaccharide biosynthesis protein